MAAMAGNTLSFSHRLMLNLMAVHLGLNLRVAIKADLAWLVLDKIGLIGAVRTVTHEAIAFGKR